MSIPLDAREILNHLNQLGYRNITPEQLKEFQKGRWSNSFVSLKHSSPILFSSPVKTFCSVDLRKLIKFDTRSGPGVSTVDQNAIARAAQHMNAFQRLHTLTTISYNAKIARKPSSKPQSTANSVREFDDGPQRSKMVTPVDEQDGKENHQMGGKSRKPHKEKEHVANKMCK